MYSTPPPKPERYAKSGVSVSKNMDSRVTKLVGINKKKKGGLAGG